MPHKRNFRGSRKHVIDLVSSIDYPNRLQPVLESHGIVLTPKDPHRPIGLDQSEEWELPGFCRRHCEGWLSKSSDGSEWDSVFKGWWRRHRGKLPTWDLISTCLVKERRGLLLIEAKAHESELVADGKVSDQSASDRSQENHVDITLCIEEACKGLRKHVDERIAISIDSHYQLSNRLSWAWRLAEHGVPVVLLYLGFIGDTYFRRDYFVDADHWQRTVGAYMSGALPVSLPGRCVDVPGGGSFMMLIGSLPVARISTFTGQC